MTADQATLRPTSAGFAMAGSITILISTALAWAKDAYQPLTRLMNALAWHNWITHGLADVMLFVGLGLTFSKTAWAARATPDLVISFLAAAVVLGGTGLFVWYAVF